MHVFQSFIGWGFFTPKKTIIHNSLPGNNRLTLPPASQGTEFSSQTFWCENFSLNKQRKSKIPHNKTQKHHHLLSSGWALSSRFSVQTIPVLPTPHPKKAALLPGQSPSPVELCPSYTTPMASKDEDMSSWSQQPNNPGAPSVLSCWYMHGASSGTLQGGDPVPHPTLSPARPSGETPSLHTWLWHSPSFPKIQVSSCSDGKGHVDSQTTQHWPHWALSAMLPLQQNYSRKPALCFCSHSSLLPPQRETPHFQRPQGTLLLSKHKCQIASTNTFVLCWFELRDIALCWTPG